jgi:hypothetical protein
MKHEVLIGQADYTVLVKIRDDAGAPATGKAHTDVDIAYARVETDNDVTTSDVAPASLSALTDAHTDWGFKEVSATDHPGVYRLDIADAVFASGAWSAVVSITGTGLDPTDLEFVLVAFNPRDGVRLGLTSLPNAAADAAGGLPISDAGGLDLDTILARITGNVALASVLGALNDAAVDGDPTTSDTVMQYVKQVVNTLVGSAGVPTFPAAAAPGNAVSLAEVLRQIYTTQAAAPTVQNVVDGILNEATASHTTAGTVSKLLIDLLALTDTEIAAIKTVVDAIQAKTDNLPTDPADASVVSGLIAASETKIDTIDGIVDAIKALLDDARAEPGQGAPPVNPDAMTKLDYLYKAFRNKLTQTSTTLSIFADDGSTVDHKSTVSDDGTTYTRGEMATGA